jgi:sulfoacetaldehyde acetyltransferase
MAEVLNRVILKAKRGSHRPDQRAARLLDPGDRHRTARQIVEFERPRGGEAAIEQAAKLLSKPSSRSS